MNYAESDICSILDCAICGKIRLVKAVEMTSHFCSVPDDVVVGAGSEVSVVIPLRKEKNEAGILNQEGDKQYLDACYLACSHGEWPLPSVAIYGEYGEGGAEDGAGSGLADLTEAGL